jgi:TetR/AcrR family transcriptional regulator, fatty acid biosynthesis regulator
MAEGPANTPGVAAAAAPVSRREATRQTRERLLHAALAILDETGEKGLTTTAVTRRAGLAQSGFYVHFADMGALMHELVTEQWAERREASRRARKAAGARADATVADVVRASFRSTVTRAAAHPALLRLVLRSRLDPDSRLGEATRAKDARSRQRIVERLASTGTPVGTATERRRAEMVADGLIAVTEALVLGHIDGRYRDVEEIVDVLVAFTAAATVDRPDS